MARSLQEVCTPVALEVGAPPDEDLLGDPAFRQELDEVTERVRSTYGHTPEELDNGQAARRALSTLGCDACKLSGVCVVKTELETHVEAGKKDAEQAAKITMLASAPAWLSAARISQSGVDPTVLKQTLSDTERTMKALRNGEIDLDALLGGTTNQIEGVYTKGDLPELASISAIRPDQELEAYDITTKNGQHFTVVDASEAIDFKGKPLPRAEYGILASKLLGRLSELGPDGEPQIAHPDQKMQKAINKLPKGAELDELRMSGKNRMYLTVLKHPADHPETTARIVILGAHGGDAATQRQFIDSAIA